MLTNIQGKRVSDHFDFIRGLAALIVLIYHVRYRFFFDYGDLSEPDLATRLFYVTTAFGHDAVMIFFVLSGYFISASVIRDCTTNRWSWRRYSINRLSRLYVVLIPGILLTLFWDVLGLELYPDHPVYSGEPQTWQHDYFPVRDRLGANTLAANLLFLQMTTSPPLGSNDALWSLSYEFWYYVLFPLAWRGISQPSKPVRALLSLGLCGALLAVLGKGIRLYFPMWLLGVAVCLGPRLPWLTGGRWRVAAAGAIGVFLATLFFTHTAAFQSQVSSSKVVADYFTGITFAAMAYVLVQNQAPSRGDAFSRVSKTLSGFSYTLYVVHLPLLVFLRAAFVPGAPWSPTALTMLWALLLTLLGVGYAAVVAQFTEHKTDVVRNFLLGKSKLAT